jgi:hypothetical protein
METKKPARTLMLERIAEDPKEYRAELFGIRDSLNGTVWGNKNAQWKIMNYALLIDFTLVLALEKLGGASGLVRSSADAWLLLAFFWPLILSVYIVALRMIFKTEADLDFHRKLTALNDDFIAHSEVKGVDFFSIVNEEFPHLTSQTSYPRSAAEGRSVFSNVFCGVLLLSAAMSSIVGFLLLLPRIDP